MFLSFIKGKFYSEKRVDPVHVKWPQCTCTILSVWDREVWYTFCWVPLYFCLCMFASWFRVLCVVGGDEWIYREKGAHFDRK